MSYDDIRKQLDILLGPNRDGVQREAPPTSFKDPRVCKYYLCGVCPHLLFSNTKADVGPCDKVHDDNLKKEYEQARNRGEYFGYEEELERFCKKLISDVDRRIERAMRRLQVQYGIESERASELLAYYPGPGRTLLGVIDEEGKEDLANGVGGLIGQTEHYYSDRDDEEEDEKYQESRSGEQAKSRTSTKGIKILSVDGSTVENSGGTASSPSNQHLDSNRSVGEVSSTGDSKEEAAASKKEENDDSALKNHSGDSVKEPSAEQEAKEDATRKQQDTTASVGKEHSTVSSSSAISEGTEVWKEAKSPDGRSYWYNVATRESRWQPPVGVKLVPLTSVRSATSEGSHNTATDSVLSGDLSGNQQKLRVCAECGAFLSIFDSSRRLVDHFNGKMHMGFVTLRKKVKELEEETRRMRESSYSRNYRTSRRRDDFYRSDYHRSDSRRRRSHHSRSPDPRYSKRHRSPSNRSSDEDRPRRSSHSYSHSRSSSSYRHRHH